MWTKAASTLRQNNDYSIQYILSEMCLPKVKFLKNTENATESK